MNPEIPFAKSLPDYIMRWLASRLPGLGRASWPSSRSARSAARSVQLEDEPPRPWTNSAGSAPGAVAGVSRTYVTVPSSSTVLPGQSAGRASRKER